MKTFETRKGWRFRGLPIHRTSTASRPHGPPVQIEIEAASLPRPPCSLSAGRLLPLCRPRPPFPPGASCHPPSPPGASSLTVARRLPVRRRWKAKVAVARGATVRLPSLGAPLSARHCPDRDRDELLPVRPPPAASSLSAGRLVPVCRRRRERGAEGCVGGASDGRRGAAAA